jgi:hypothetical protein
MKTAMQELIEHLEANDRKFTYTYKKAIELLEKEKEQIIDAVAKGRKQKVENGFWGYTYTPEEIYNQYN